MKLLALALLAAASAVAESVLDFSKMPDCAQQCAVLKQADAGCVPPAAPATDQAIYQSCVCQSALLTTLHSSGALCQQTGCSTDDATKISQYYVGLCNGPVVQPADTTTTATTTTTGTAAATATAGAADANRVSSSAKDDWFSTHWKWVVMVIIIFLAIVFFWVGGTCLRRHYSRKHDAERANLAARDAPYNPPDPESKSTPMSKTTENSSEITMSGGRNGMPVAAPARTMTSRSRSNTLQSIRFGNSSRTSIPQPVVWGPHQHLAHSNSNVNNNSPDKSVPPSPSSAIAPPVFRNRDAMMSERYIQRHGTPNSVNGAPTRRFSSAHGTPRHVNWTPSASAENIERPHTTSGERESIRGVKRHTLTSVKSDPSMTPEPQSAEFCEVTPQKLQKPQKH